MPAPAPPAPSSRRRWWLVALGLLLLALFAGRHALFGEPVRVVSVTRGDLRQAIVASGRVRTPQRIELASQLTGRVEQILVNEGDRVAPGQLLLRLDDREARANAEQARAALALAETRLAQLGDLSAAVAEQSLRQAEAQRLQARQQFARTEALVARQFYSPAQLDEARRALAVAESQYRAAELQLASNRPGGSEMRAASLNIEQARASLAAATTRLSHTRLTAPTAGTILGRLIEAGDTLQAGKGALIIAPDGGTELTAQIDEKHLGLLRPGQIATVAADAFPQQPFRATLNYIAPAVDAQRGSVEVRLRVDQPPAFLKHEMTVSIDLDTGSRQGTLRVPAEALRDLAGPQPWVMVVRDGQTVRQPVQVGLKGPGLVEIIDGVHEGEAVLPASAPQPAGRRVRPQHG